MYISQYLYLTALQQHANFKNYYIQIKSQGTLHLKNSSTLNSLKGYVDIGQLLTANPLQPLGEKNLYYGHSHIC